MSAVHVDINDAQNSDFEERINPRTVGQTRDVKTDGADVEGEDIGVFHQRSTASEKPLTQFPRYILGRGKTRFQFGEEALELWCAPLLTATVVGVVVVEQLFEPLSAARQRLINGSLLPVAVQFAPFPTLEKEEMNLPVIVGQ